MKRKISRFKNSESKYPSIHFSHSPLAFLDPDVASSISTMIPLLLLLLAASPAASEDDVGCLKGFKSAVSDPDGHLSWNFSNTTVGFICSFTGVTCWNLQENRVLSLALPSSSLSGPVPSSLRLCSSMTTLDLSSNNLSGPVPSDLCSWLPYLVNLDLSSNAFSGSIPANLADCKFLNKLHLGSNNLSGPIPSTLSLLDRLKDLDLSENDLSGPIPQGLSKFDSQDFQGNSGLCGEPVSSGCTNKSVTRTSLIIIVAAGVFGAAASLAVAYAVWRFCFSAKAVAAKRRKEMEAAAAGGAAGKGVEEGRWWSDRLRSSHNRLVPVSLFHRPIVKVKLADLMAATEGFHPDHIVVAGSSRIGTSYKAVLRDGSALTVKRLLDCQLSEKQFRMEMGRMGQIRHPNLVPLLGYCVVEDERLLIYKYVENGALSALIRDAGDEGLDWPARLRIGIGGARGLAWLHHGFQVPFLHQNVSSTAVLLDEDYEPRITDFGLGSLMRPWPEDSGLDTPPPPPFVKFGEFGYVAPEYASNPVPSTKGDVYGFGVVLLELATGQKAVEVSSDVAGEGFKGNLVDWVTQLYVAGRTREAIDKSLRGKGHDNQILEFLKVACGCVVVPPQERFSMYKVYQSLKSIGGEHEHSEEFDEFPLVYGKDDPESA